MNFLAHLHLSYPDPHLMLGNFLADFLSKNENDRLPQAVRRGVHLHQSIDTYADQHAEMKASKRLLYPTQGKYAMVLIDLFYDYFLAMNWEVFHTTSLDAFCEDVYQIFEAHMDALPQPAYGFASRLIEYQWLNKFESYAGIEDSIQRLLLRSSFESNMDTALSDMKRFEAELNDHFLMFYPDMQEHVAREVLRFSPQS